MRKITRYILWLMCGMVLLLSGCQKQKTEDNIKEILQAETLSVENDVLNVDVLLHVIGQDENSISEMSGMEKDGESYSTKLFGEPAKIEAVCEDGIIQKLQIKFSKVDFEAISNAISEQMGQDGEVKKEKVEWECEDYKIKLSGENQESLIEISRKEQ